MDQQLFNGDYYQQKVEFTISATVVRAVHRPASTNQSSEMQQLLKREGPKYQYGSGCLSDGVIGAWMARIYGIATPLAQKNVHSTLQAIFRNNFKTDLSQHANAQRPGYAMGHEPGLLLCTWPRGDKAHPSLRLLRRSVDRHRIPGGLAPHSRRIRRRGPDHREGAAQPLRRAHPQSLERIRMRQLVRPRHVELCAGRRALRLPLFGCGSTLHFGPKLKVRPFTSFFSTASGYGAITVEDHNISVASIEGELEIDALAVHRYQGRSLHRVEDRSTSRCACNKGAIAIEIGAAWFFALHARRLELPLAHSERTAGHRQFKMHLRKPDANGGRQTILPLHGRIV